MEGERRRKTLLQKWVPVANVLVGTLLVIVTVLLLMSLTTEAANRREAARAINTSRTDAARDTCNLFVGLAHAAVKGNSAAQARTNAYIARTPLRDCNAYALRVGTVKVKR